MAMRLDMRLSEKNLLIWQFGQYGIHKKCLRCPLFNKCDTPQYDAPGLTKFTCAAYSRAIKKGGKHER